MKILQISTSSKGGGAERLAMDLHNAYLNRGLDAHIVVGYQRSDITNLYGLIDLRTVRGLMIRQLLAYAERWTGIQGAFSPFFRRWVNRHCTNWDVIHCHNLHGSGYIAFRDLIDCVPHASMVITLHDLWLLTGHCAHPIDCSSFHHECGSCPALQRYVRVACDRTRENAHRKRQLLSLRHPLLIGVSKWVCQAVRDANLSNECRVVYNGVDTKHFSPVEQAMARRKLGLPDDIHIALYVVSGGLSNARQNDFKRPEYIIEACRILKQRIGPDSFRLITVGGKGDLPFDIKDIVIQYDRIEDNLNLFYSAADVTVHASIADTFGLVLAESLSCGTPVVTTNTGGCPEVVTQGQTGYVVPLDGGSSMADAVASIFAGNTTISRENCRKRAKEIFSLDRMVDEYVAIYHELQHKKLGGLARVPEAQYRFEKRSPL